jgi:ferredoxin
MLVIHPDECIDCGVCVPECPVDAIKPDTEPGLDKWLSLDSFTSIKTTGGSQLRHAGSESNAPLPPL